MDESSAGFIVLVLAAGIFGVGMSVGADSSTKDMTASQYTQAQDKCKDHESVYSVYSVGVSSDKVKVFCKDNVEFVLEKN